MEETFYKMMINTEKDTIFIQLKDEKYQNVLAKVGHLEYNDDNELEFDMELPKGCEKFYDDETFINLIQNAVYDIVATSVKTYWNEAETKVLKDIETQLTKLFAPYNIDKGDRTYLDLFAEQGYIVSMNDDEQDEEHYGKLMTTNPLKDDKIYYFDNKDDFGFLKQLIGGSSLVI